MNIILSPAFKLARASNQNPVVTMATVLLFWLMFNMLFMVTEILIFGDRFEHWGDVALAFACIGYSGLCVHCCAVINEDDKALEIAYRTSQMSRGSK